MRQQRGDTNGAMSLHQVEVAVAILAREGKLLAVYNPKWGAFSLPMTKRKRWQDPQVTFTVREEDWSVSAMRAAAELLGTTFAPAQFPRELLEIKEYHQSGEDGIWKVYHFKIFAVPVPGDIRTNEIVDWLSPAQFESHQPISTTAAYLIHALGEKGLLPPWKS